MMRSKSIIPIGLAIGLLFHATAFASFPDVPSSHRNHEAVSYVQQENIVSGYPDRTYKPDNTINRAEFVKILVQAKADESAIRACYDEVEPAHWAFVERMHDEWYAPYVCYAKKFHLIDGYPDGTFRPANNINFVEAAKIISKAFDLPTSSDAIWYKPFVVALAQKQAIPASVSSFDQLITRGEMAEMIYGLQTGKPRSSVSYDLIQKLSSDSQEYTQPVSIVINDACLKSDYDEKTGQKISVICANLGEVQLSPAIKAVLKPKHKEKTLSGDDYEFDVYLEFYQGGTKLNVPPHYFPSFADANTSWFGLDISYLSNNAIYISDSGGHEGYPSHLFFDGSKWSKLSAWELVKEVFPDTIEPPFSIQVSPSRLKITEENYYSDRVYSDSLDREKNRMVFVLDRLSGRIIESSRIQR